MNTFYLVFYQVAMVLSLLTSLSVMALLWKNRRVSGTSAMIVLAASMFVWTLGYFLEANSSTLERQIFFSGISYLGSMIMPVAWLIFTLRYTGGNRPVVWWHHLLLFIIPVSTIVLVWSNGWHHLMWSNEHLFTSGPFLVTAKTYSLFFWIAISYRYLLIIIGVIILIQRLFAVAPLYAGQAVSLTIAISLPLLWNAIYVFDLVPLPRKDLTPVMFTISGVAILIGLVRFRLFKAVPFANRFIVSQINDGVMVFDIYQCLLEANPAALKITGLGRDIIGRKLEELVPLSPVMRQMPVMSSGYVELALMLSGEERFYDLETTTLRDARGRQIGWLAILHDVTEKKRAERALQERESMYRLLADNMVDVIWISDLDLRLTYVTPSVERLLGFSVAEMMANTMEEVLTPESFKKVNDTFSEEMAREKLPGRDLKRSRTLELQMFHKNGSIIPVEVNYLAIRSPDNEIKSILAVSRDISSRKRAEEALTAAFEKEKELRLNLEEEARKRLEFSRALVHELKTPLTPMVVTSELLLSELKVEPWARMARNIYQGADKLSQRIDELLDLAKGELGLLRLRIELVSFLTLLNDVVCEMIPVAAKKKQSLTAELPSSLPDIRIDKERIKQVLQNLLNNASKFTEEGGKITLRAREENGSIVVEVEDNGIGMTEAQQARLFQPYHRQDEDRPRMSGLGLGLALSKNLVELHDGRIWGQSTKGKGSVFGFSVPVKGPDGAPHDDVKS